ncbi:UNVERIFIED_CONTAM: hypothetical protein FKN15_012889 [Acipenser sinensis]
MSCTYWTLSTGQKMPLVGLGTWKSAPGEVKQAVLSALDSGYRHIDCAAAYGNEQEVGEALRERVGPGKVKQAVLSALDSGYRHIDCAAAYGNEQEVGEALRERVGPGKPIKREHVFVTSKLWNTKHHPDDVEPACRKSLADLGLPFLDLYLMHWPMAFERGEVAMPRNADGTLRYADTDYRDTWRAMEKLMDQGLVRAIGLSNFNARQTNDILDISKHKPVVNQVECHPHLTQKELLTHCRARGIMLTAYSPLGSPDRPWASPEEPHLLDDPQIVALARRYGKTPAQVIIRWQVQRGVVCIPKSTTPSRIKENIQVFDFTLSEEDVKLIESFNRKERLIVPTIEVRLNYK